MQLISGSEPRIGAAFADKFYRNPQGRLAFIKQSHGTPPHDLIEWIKTMLQPEESHPRAHSSETGQGISDNTEVLQVITATGLASQQNDTIAAMHAKLAFTQERCHCHIARSYPPMPHYDSARYRPYPHVLRARSNPLRFVRSARRCIIWPAHTAHDGIQGESSEHEHQKAHTSSSSETGNISHVTPVISHERASQKQSSKARKGEPLSDASVVELNDVLTRLSLAVDNLGKCILAAESSQVIEPVSVTKLSVQKAELENMKDAIEAYIGNNKEHDTDAALGTLADMVNDACKQSRIVNTVLTLEHYKFYESEWSIVQV